MDSKNDTSSGPRGLGDGLGRTGEGLVGAGDGLGEVAGEGGVGDGLRRGDGVPGDGAGGGRAGGLGEGDGLAGTGEGEGRLGDGTGGEGCLGVGTGGEGSAGAGEALLKLHSAADSVWHGGQQATSQTTNRTCESADAQRSLTVDGVGLRHCQLEALRQHGVLSTITIPPHLHHKHLPSGQRVDVFHLAPIPARPAPPSPPVRQW